jgi:hypothetical protein
MMRPHALILMTILAGCKPDLGAPASLVVEPRVLAIQSEPAEVVPGHDVALTALIASPDGALTPDVAWGFCAAPAPLASNNVVGDDCIYGAASLPGRGAAVTATIPIEACSVFGPTPPAPAPGEPARRPHDADVSGGYYQPIRALAKLDPQVPAIGLTRISCDLANASLDVVQAFRARYHANTNPVLAGLEAVLPDGRVVALPGTLPAGAVITLRASWTDASPETYPVFDPASRALVDHREAIRVSWFVSDGALAAERTGRGEDEPEVFAEDVWTTPAAGPAHLWVVVRDSRGGVAFAAVDVAITP